MKAMKYFFLWSKQGAFPDRSKYTIINMAIRCKVGGNCNVYDRIQGIELVVLVSHRVSLNGGTCGISIRVLAGYWSYPVSVNTFYGR